MNELPAIVYKSYLFQNSEIAENHDVLYDAFKCTVSKGEDIVNDAIRTIEDLLEIDQTSSAENGSDDQEGDDEDDDQQMKNEGSGEDDGDEEEDDSSSSGIVSEDEQADSSKKPLSKKQKTSHSEIESLLLEWIKTRVAILEKT